jgi:hypothetical protein
MPEGRGRNGRLLSRFPRREAVFGRNGQTSLVSQVMFPSTKFTGGTFPRRHWLQPRVPV